MKEKRWRKRSKNAAGVEVKRSKTERVKAGMSNEDGETKVGLKKKK